VVLVARQLEADVTARQESAAVAALIGSALCSTGSVVLFESGNSIAGFVTGGVGCAIAVITGLIATRLLGRSR
jgi:hypothetical protein